MREPISRDARLALDLALTIRHDGNGGVADDLTDPAGLTAWVRAHPEALPTGARGRADDRGAAPQPSGSDRHAADADAQRVAPQPSDSDRHAAGADAQGVAPQHDDGGCHAAGFTADAAQLTAVRALRDAVRALFARAVRPGEPSPADAARLMPLPEAVRHLNEAAARTPTVPALDWPEGAVPVVHRRPVDVGDDLTASLAHAVIAFLASPDRDRLRACHAPRCVRYFLKEHPRQEWCKPSCGNRARVARHHQRHRATA
uniref:CGNR zinc finger domain-containing protein n=1 Tax=Streptomyces hawaiiensis TaxID=67305 RepID=UPI0031DB5421